MTNKRWSRDDVKDWIYEMKKAQLEDCGCDDLDSPSLYDDEVGPPEEPEGGAWSPDELYQHFDVDQDGEVSMGDYADHVSYHEANPDILAPFERQKSRAMQNARCPDSYGKAGDLMIQIPEDIIEMLKPLMQKAGAGCPASFAQAMADVLGIALDQDVVKPFNVESEDGEGWK